MRSQYETIRGRRVPNCVEPHSSDGRSWWPREQKIEEVQGVDAPGDSVKMQSRPLAVFVNALVLMTVTLSAAPVENLATLVKASLSSRYNVSALELCQVVCRVANVSKSRAELIKCILLPVLRHIQSAALEALQNLHRTCIQEMYSTVFEQFLLSYVRRQPSLQPCWSRDPVRCGCGDCHKLNLFLISVTRQTDRFSLGKKRRQHLHQVLDCTDYSHVTDRRSSGETLVVAKRDPQRPAHDACVARCREARSPLLQFNDQDSLWKLLRDPKMLDDMMAMRSVITDPGSVPAELKRLPLQDLDNNKRPSNSAGVKRRFDDSNTGRRDDERKRQAVIDLCSDSD